MSIVARRGIITNCFDAERENVDAFAVEYYRTLSSGIPSELFNAALYQPI
jgi:hypothetical protein